MKLRRLGLFEPLRLGEETRLDGKSPRFEAEPREQGMGGPPRLEDVDTCRDGALVAPLPRAVGVRLVGDGAVDEMNARRQHAAGEATDVPGRHSGTSSSRRKAASTT